jgi:hypothetical protein
MSRNAPPTSVEFYRHQRCQQQRICRANEDNSMRDLRRNSDANARNLLVIYWLILTEERFAVLIPTPGGMLEMSSTICDAQRYVKVTLPLGEMLETTSTIRDVQRFASMTQPHTDQHVQWMPRSYCPKTQTRPPESGLFSWPAIFCNDTGS